MSYQKKRSFHKLLVFGSWPLLDCEVTTTGALVGSTIMSLVKLGRSPTFFLSFLLGTSLSLPGMIFPGCIMLNITSATNIGKESRQYWYASWFGMVLVRTFEYSAMRNKIRSQKCCQLHSVVVEMGLLRLAYIL